MEVQSYIFFIDSYVFQLVKKSILTKACVTYRLGVTFTADSRNGIRSWLQANCSPEMPQKLTGWSESRSKSSCSQEWIPFLQSALKVTPRRYVTQTFVKIKFLTNWSTTITYNSQPHSRAISEATKMPFESSNCQTIFFNLRFVAFQLDHWLAYSKRIVLEWQVSETGK